MHGQTVMEVRMVNVHGVENGVVCKAGLNNRTVQCFGIVATPAYNTIYSTTVLWPDTTHHKYYTTG